MGQTAISGPHRTSEDEAELAAGEEGSQPFVALGLPQASPNEEDLDTIAEEPLAETRAAQSQSSDAQETEKSSPQRTEQQQIPKSEDGSSATSETNMASVSSRDDQIGSHAGNQGDRQTPDHPRDAGGPGNVGESEDPEGYGRMHAEGDNQASHSNSSIPSKQSHHSLTGSLLSCLSCTYIVANVALVRW